MSGGRLRGLMNIYRDKWTDAEAVLLESENVATRMHFKLEGKPFHWVFDCVIVAAWFVLQDSMMLLKSCLTAHFCLSLYPHMLQCLTGCWTVVLAAVVFYNVDANKPPPPKKKPHPNK